MNSVMFLRLVHFFEMSTQIKSLKVKFENNAPQSFEGNF